MRTHTLRRCAVTGALALGLTVGAAAVANAASGGGSTAPPGATGGNPATVAHGPGETLLAGSTAAKVTAAARTKVPGATVLRVETDSAGAAYEAHLRRANGSYVTVKLDRGFDVTAVQPGFGAGPAGPGSPWGAAAG